MCVTLGGADILMTEQFGYSVEIYFTLCQPCSNSVAQSVKREILDPCSTHCIHQPKGVYHVYTFQRMNNNSKEVDRIQEPPKVTIRFANALFMSGILFSVLNEQNILLHTSTPDTCLLFKANVHNPLIKRC